MPPCSLHSSPVLLSQEQPESRHRSRLRPARLAAPRRLQGSSPLGEEPHPQASVAETPLFQRTPRRLPCSWKPSQGAWCPVPRASPPGCSVTGLTQGLAIKTNSTSLQTSLSPNFRELLSSPAKTSGQRVRGRAESKSHEAFIYKRPPWSPGDRTEGGRRRGRPPARVPG